MKKFTESELNTLWGHFKNLNQEALYASHYDLFEKTNYANPETWKEFLLLPEVVEYIRIEMEIIRKAAMNELVANAGDSNSVGKAQLLNAITKQDEDISVNDGPVFIYTYVPLNSEQEKAPNVFKEKTDIFKRASKDPFTL
jgi:hypothetical protein